MGFAWLGVVAAGGANVVCVCGLHQADQSDSGALRSGEWQEGRGDGRHRVGVC